jgi:ATP-dependent Lon protease
MNKSSRETIIPIISGLDDKVEIPSQMPILPLRSVVIFPGMVVPLAAGRHSSITLVDEATAGNRLIGAIVQKKAEADEPGVNDIHAVGTVCRIEKLLRQDENQRTIIVQGLRRFRVKKWIKEKPYFVAEIEILAEHVEKTKEIEALTLNLKRLASRMVELSPNIPAEVAAAIQSITGKPGVLLDFVAGGLSGEIEKRQDILETLDIKERFEKVNAMLTRQVEILELGDKIQSQVRNTIDKTQREFVLREQLKAIQQELGEKDKTKAELDELRQKIKKAKMTPEADKEAKRELDRMSSMPPAAPEYSVIKTYIQWLTELPWSVSTRDKLEIPKVEKVLEEDHYDLEKVKQRVLEYLAVRKLKPDAKGPILCFVGPPGVGKTSLGRSIARALGRKFVRISLGGVRDEAEIRGHRRTYIGALPGRIIQGIRKAGSNNPVFMLDEVDKIGADFRGDPSSALLEVLDPEQNNSFSDHYLNVSFDLSKVMFITTANILDPIPPALKDRMEVMELPGYIPEEKLAIAKKYLVPRQMEQNGIKNGKLKIGDSALMGIISSYTREAGVRNLEREIATICRRTARKIAEGRHKPKTVQKKGLSEYLGPEKFFPEAAERTARPGVATGLAWTPAGGELIFIEAAKMPGKGNLSLTGQLGEVMTGGDQLHTLKRQAVPRSTELCLQI